MRVERREDPMPVQRLLVPTLVGALLFACGEPSDEPPAPAAPEPSAAAPLEPARLVLGRVDSARLLGADAEPGSWMTHGRDYAEQRFSPLDQIHTGNVGELGLAWSFDLGSTRGVEATPIVVDGVLYVTASWSPVFALDARSGELLWQYDPQVPGDWGRNACCDVVNRGVAVWKGAVYVGTLDGRLVSLDAATGAVNWEVLTIDPERPYTITGAPRVVKDKVIIGNGGAEFGVRGYVSAYDAATGEQVWRFYTVPGDPSQPFENPELERAAATWSGEWWTVGGGGTAWDAIAYDPELDLLYVGTGNGSPWSRYARDPAGGDNLFVCSILALRPDTGELVWHYQTTPGDNWDYTSVQHMILADLEIGGRERKVLMQAPKNGFFYVLDRASGELISAEPYVKVTWASGVDPATGRPVETAIADYRGGAQLVTPGPSGAHNWHPMSFHPGTGLVYIPAQDLQAWYTYDANFAYRPLEANLGLDLDALADQNEREPPAMTGHLLAWDPVAQKAAWRVQHPALWNGGLLSTAGGLVFQGTADGRFVAYDAATGEPLWETRSETGIMAAPATYTLDGEQHVVVAAGYGGGVMYLGALPNAAIERSHNEGRVLVFKRGGRAPIPTNTPRDLRVPEPPPLTASAEDVAEGRTLYNRLCFYCHGPATVSSFVVPDLRLMRPETHEIFSDIVVGGVRSAKGMPSFAALMTPEEVERLHAYIVAEARKAFDAQQAEGAAAGSAGRG
jgi:PQQ-dependent dehydrogenase (methanol/ethanol family)